MLLRARLWKNERGGSLVVLDGRINKIVMSTLSW